MLNKKDMRTRFSIAMCLFFIALGCKSQQQALPSYVGLSVPLNAATDPDPVEYVNWYNNLVKEPKFDTAMVFKTLAHSDLRYVMIRPENPTDVARVETSHGRFLYFLSGERTYFDQVGFNEKGEVTEGLKGVMISGCPLVIQYERCKDCTFIIDKKGTL